MISSASIDREMELIIEVVANMIGAFGSSVFGRRELTMVAKLKVVNTMVLPTLTYGSLAWNYGQGIYAVQVTQMRAFR